MKRLFYFVLALIAAGIFLIPILIIAVLIKLTSRGAALYWSDRAGKHNQIFNMPKFRSMKIETPIVATHFLEHPESMLTPMGEFLRKTSLDELPQILCILKGEVSFVGPRPALFNQEDLIALRSEKGVDKILPGLTGWAQVNGRDELTISEKVLLDVEYLDKQSFKLDLYILLLTALRVVSKNGLSH